MDALPTGTESNERNYPPIVPAEVGIRLIVMLRTGIGKRRCFAASQILPFRVGDVHRVGARA